MECAQLRPKGWMDHYLLLHVQAWSKSTTSTIFRFHLGPSTHVGTVVTTHPRKPRLRSIFQRLPAIRTHLHPPSLRIRVLLVQPYTASVWLLRASNPHEAACSISHPSRLSPTSPSAGVWHSQDPFQVKNLLGIDSARSPSTPSSIQHPQTYSDTVSRLRTSSCHHKLPIGKLASARNGSASGFHLPSQPDSISIQPSRRSSTFAESTISAYYELG